MINTRELKAQMVRMGYTNKELAGKIGCSESKVQRILKSGNCDMYTADKIVDVLQIDDPTPIFFAKKST